MAPFALRDGWSPLLVGAVFSGTPVGYGIGALVGGRLADQLPPRRLCWAALGLLAAGFAIAFAVPSGFTFVVFYSALALGLGGGVALTGGLSAATQVFPGRAGLVGGALTAAMASGSIFQAPLVTALAHQLGWMTALKLVAGVFALVAVGALLALPALPRPRAHSESPDSVPMSALIGRPLLWTGVLIEFCATPAGPYTFVNLAGYVTRHQLEPWLAPAALVAISITNSASRLVIGLAADRFGVNRSLLVVLGCAIAACGLLLAGASPPLLIIAAGAAGMAVGGAAGVQSRMAAEVAPDAPHAAFGLIFVGFAAGAVAGPVVPPALVGVADRGWLLVGLPALLGLGLLAFRRRLGRR